MKKIFAIFLVFSIFPSFAFKLEVKATRDSVDAHEAGGNYYMYPWTEEKPPVLTPAPEGYIPYHMEHYGRHGSRWHIGDKNYQKTFEILYKANQEGKLTAFGQELLKTVSEIRDEFLKGRDGELSDRGALQHYGIGKRMVLNFPELLNSETNVDARSTVVIRCILSMQNSLKGIQSMIPDLNVVTDASNADMWYMNHDDPEAMELFHKAIDVYLKPYQEKHKIDNSIYQKKIFNDASYARDSVGDELTMPLFYLLVNSQSHIKQPWLLEDVFTPEEIRELWLSKNAYWLLRSGNTAMTENKIPFSQKNLLNNIIASADTALTTEKPSANLRYGHDTVIFPLVVLMEINDFGTEINDFDFLAANGWHDYLVTPMGANLQMIFYRPFNKDFTIDDILVKVLLNEEEVRLPGQQVAGPYYKWSDLRNYYLEKIAD